MREFKRVDPGSCPLLVWLRRRLIVVDKRKSTGALLIHSTIANQEVKRLRHLGALSSGSGSNARDIGNSCKRAGQCGEQESAKHNHVTYRFNTTVIGAASVGQTKSESDWAKPRKDSACGAVRSPSSGAPDSPALFSGPIATVARIEPNSLS